MCTLIILRRPRDPWPLLLAGNRDEMPDRPWAPPARHWQDRPDLVAGFDQLAQGMVLKPAVEYRDIANTKGLPRDNH